MTWRKLAMLVRWLPKDAPLWESMRQAQPPEHDGETDAMALVVTDALTAMQYGPTDRLVLAVLNHLEGRAWANADPEKRGPFTPMLLPGYGLPQTAADSPDALAQYFQRLQPQTIDDQPEV